MTALCPYADRGCPDSDGDFDVVMPEPMFGTSGSGYKVRVADATDDSISDCSDEFYLMASEEAPEVGDDDGPTIVVTSPSDGDSAVPGEEYTVEVREVNMLILVLTVFRCTMQNERLEDAFDTCYSRG